MENVFGRLLCWSHYFLKLMDCTFFLAPLRYPKALYNCLSLRHSHTDGWLLPCKVLACPVGINSGLCILPKGTTMDCKGAGFEPHSHCPVYDTSNIVEKLVDIPLKWRLVCIKQPFVVWNLRSFSSSSLPVPGILSLPLFLRFWSSQVPPEEEWNVESRGSACSSWTAGSQFGGDAENLLVEVVRWCHYLNAERCHADAVQPVAIPRLSCEDTALCLTVQGFSQHASTAEGLECRGWNAGASKGFLRRWCSVWPDWRPAPGAGDGAAAAVLWFLHTLQRLLFTDPINTRICRKVSFQTLVTGFTDWVRSAEEAIRLWQVWESYLATHLHVIIKCGTVSMGI